MAAMVEWSPALDQVVHEVSVDFVSRTNMPQPIHIVQGDMTMPVVAVKLYKNGSPYAVPIAASGNVRWEKPKPSASYSYNPLLGLSDDRSTVYFEVTRQMSSVFGKTYAVVEIELGTNRRIASSPIPVFIDRDPIQPTDIEDTNEYETLLEYVAEAAASAESSAGSATKSANSAAESRESASRAATSGAASRTAGASWSGPVPTTWA